MDYKLIALAVVMVLGFYKLYCRLDETNRRMDRMFEQDMTGKAATKPAPVSSSLPPRQVPISAASSEDSPLSTGTRSFLANATGAATSSGNEGSLPFKTR